MLGETDVTAIFESGDFDEDASFATTPTPTTVRAWFTDKTEGSQIYNIAVEAAAPTLMMNTADVPDGALRMTVTVRSVAYTVERIENAGTGISVLYLKT